MPQVMLNQDTYLRITDYAELLGISAEEATNEAIHEWMDQTGDLVAQMVVAHRSQAHENDARKRQKRRASGKSKAEIIRFLPRSALSPFKDVVPISATGAD